MHQGIHPIKIKTIYIVWGWNFIFEKIWMATLFSFLSTNQVTNFLFTYENQEMLSDP